MEATRQPPQELMAPDPRTRAQRFMRRLFPYAMPPLPEPVDVPAFSTYTTVCLDWKDRLRMLVSGRLKLAYRHVSDVEVKRVHSTCSCYVESPLERP